MEKNAPMGTEKKGLESVLAALVSSPLPVGSRHDRWRRLAFFQIPQQKKMNGPAAASLYVQIGKRPQLTWLIAVSIFLNQQENRLHQTAGIGEDFCPQEPGEGRGLI